MARRWKKFALITLLVVILLVSLGITFTIGWRPFIGAKKRTLTDGAVFAYLRTLKPVKHQLDNTEPPTYCRLCKQKHGFGASN